MMSAWERRAARVDRRWPGVRAAAWRCWRLRRFSRRRPPQPARRAPPALRVVLVGLDAADWLVVDPLVASGRLPTFARLKAVGRTGILLATPPLVSPLIWTTIATGEWPDDHGILGFMVDLPDCTQGPVGSSQRLVPALWALPAAAGRRVGVIGWWATWPAETPDRHPDQRVFAVAAGCPLLHFRVDAARSLVRAPGRAPRVKGNARGVIMPHVAR